MSHGEHFCIEKLYFTDLQNFYIYPAVFQTITIIPYSYTFDVFFFSEEIGIH